MMDGELGARCRPHFETFGSDDNNKRATEEDDSFSVSPIFFRFVKYTHTCARISVYSSPGRTSSGMYNEYTSVKS
jgi:hypothetical protein